MITRSQRKLRQRHQAAAPNKNADVGESTLLSNTEVNPYNQFIYRAVSKKDPSSPIMQKMCVLTAILSTAMLLMLPQVTMLYGLDDSWDQKQGLQLFDIGALLHATLRVDVKLPLAIAAAYLGVLLLLDLLGVGWPKSWNIENTQCYEEMFSEPMRDARLIRRLGNTLSNVLYMVGSMIIAYSCFWGETKNVFVISDLMFASMLFVLAIASTTWHGSNAPLSHYVDIWSMDACILYLGIRAIGLCVYVLLKRNNVESDISEAIASWTPIALYSLQIVSNGKAWLTRYHNRWLHGATPFSVRNRLNSTARGKTSIIKMVTGDLPEQFPLPTILEGCVFGALPVIFTAPNFALYFFVFRTLGSVNLIRWNNSTLIIGWSYRMLERWVFDGCAPMNFMIRQKGTGDTSGIRSGLWTIGAALASPTAVLHIFTGVTLLAGYMHARSLDLVILGS